MGREKKAERKMNKEKKMIAINYKEIEYSCENE
jgi:hypothetical protein